MKNSGEGCPLPETASLTWAFLKEKVKNKTKQKQEKTTKQKLLRTMCKNLSTDLSPLASDKQMKQDQ